MQIMMGTKMLKQLRDGISNLNPHDVRLLAEKPVSIELFAPSIQAYVEMERFFAPAELSPKKRNEIAGLLHRSGEAAGKPTIQVYYEGMAHPDIAFTFYRRDPDRTVEEILDKHPDLGVALARHFLPFRPCVISRTIKEVSKENALFSLATAVPAILPFISLPWAIGEFASDTAFLTMNQIRMAFLLAAASDRPLGYREQKSEIASLFAGAFGWRSLARELVGKIPMGGGLIPKAAVAYAGTYVVGASLERFYRLGQGYSRTERKAAYDGAFQRGKTVAASLLQGFKVRQAV
ncbi:MAG TPA: hypothetical protein VMZ52_19460 [Bryobacteraceae bacterium]|nr:hypothetical protein [Bryobacteraceae bacterium]